MIQVKKSPNADSRSAKGKLNINDLERDTKSHVNDVKNGLDFIASLIKSRGSDHDHTKLENMNDFYNALVSGNVKETSWYKKHITEERHHLKSNVPDNVNLIDVIEHIVDCTMAGLTRSGKIYDTDINPETLELAVQNTVELLKNNIYVSEDNSSNDILNMDIDDSKNSSDSDDILNMDIDDN